jgi:hypothetical protein
VSDTPMTYGFEEARKRLKNPPPSRTAMYGMIKDGLLQVAGYFGDRPFFTDKELQDCTERLRERHQERQQDKPVRRRLAGGGR